MPKPDPDTQDLLSELHGATAILTDAEIRSMVANRRLFLDDSFDQSSLQATSYDIRIGKKAVTGGGKEFDLEETPLMIEPGSYAGVISLEKMKLPNNVLAQIGSKRKFAYDGIILLTGSVIDPGYEGHLLFGLYNASSKRVVLPTTTKICNVVFVRLPKEVRPVPSDPYLLSGSFPPDFLKNMANMEVLPWARISEEVRRIQDLGQKVVELERRYNDVLEPIRVLTKNIDKVSGEVSSLAEQIKNVSNDVEKLDDFSKKNSTLVTEVSTAVKSLAEKVGEHDREVRDVGKQVGSYTLLVKVVWAILFAVVCAFLGGFIKDKYFSDRREVPQITAPPSK